MTVPPPEGYLGAEGRLASGPSPELIEAGYGLELADAHFLHDGLGWADLSHVIELVEAKVIPQEAAADLCRELLDFLDTDPSDFPYSPVYGDAYNSRERELEKRLGTTAGWLPAGRTRREAGRIAFRLALRDRLLDLHDEVAAFTKEGAGRSEELAEAFWNDTTYLQPAQPSSFGHFLSGFAEPGIRNLARIRRCYRLVNQSPAGSGGVGGTLLPLDRLRMAERLGFSRPTAQIRDGMWSGDPMIDCGVAAMQAVLTVDRLAEDLEIFAAPQFGYVRLGGTSSRASVLLPQKRNPYALAVIRGGCGTLIGRVGGLMVTQRTPSARTDNWLYLYGEVIGAVDMAIRLVRLGTQVVRSLEVDTRKLAETAGQYFTTATDLAERLVLAGGIDYRSAYRVIGRAIAEAVRSGEDGLSEPGLTEAARAVGVRLTPTHKAQLTSLTGLDIGAVVASRDMIGGSAPDRVREHCSSVLLRLDDSVEWATTARNLQETALKSLLEHARQISGG